MGRKSKLDILVKFITDKHPSNIEDKELRVKKEEILSDEKIDIAKSTLYKLVNENDFLLVDGEDLVLKRDTMKLKKAQSAFEEIYSKYEPKIGKREMMQAEIFPLTEKQEELKELLNELADNEFIRLKMGTIEFTGRGVRKYLREQGDREYNICDLCLKPLSPNRTVITETFDLGGYDFYYKGLYHSECFTEKYSPYDEYSGEPLSCSYCGLPLSLHIFRQYSTISDIGPPVAPHFREVITRMKESDRDKLISLVSTSIQKTHLAKFKDEIKERGMSRAIEDYFKAFLKLDDPKVLFSETNDISGVIELISKYSIAENQIRLEKNIQKPSVKEIINWFIEFTGVYPEATGSQHVEVHTSTYTDGNHLYHPRCFERHKIIQQEEISKEGGNHS